MPLRSVHLLAIGSGVGVLAGVKIDGKPQDGEINLFHDIPVGKVTEAYIHEYNSFYSGLQPGPLLLSSVPPRILFTERFTNNPFDGSFVDAPLQE